MAELKNILNERSQSQKMTYSVYICIKGPQLTRLEIWKVINGCLGMWERGSRDTWS